MHLGLTSVFFTVLFRRHSTLNLEFGLKAFFSSSSFSPSKLEMCNWSCRSRAVCYTVGKSVGRPVHYLLGSEMIRACWADA